MGTIEPVWNLLDLTPEGRPIVWDEQLSQFVTVASRCYSLATPILLALRSEGERGLLGVGYAPARVLATAARPPEAPAARPEAADEGELAPCPRHFAQQP